MPASPGRSAETRERILSAAGHIVRRDGVNRLTLEAAADGAGVSKGGLLYHFPSREALLRGVLLSMVDGFLERLTHELEAAGEPADMPGRWLRAYVRATFAVDPDEYELSAALAVAVAEDPGLLSELRAAFQSFREAALGDGLPPAVASTVRLTADGLWFGEALTLGETDPALRAELLNHLIAMTFSPSSTSNP